MRTAAILPVKRFAGAKRRLGASVADPLRGDLARAMVGDVLVALAEAESIAQTIVVTGEASVVAAARHRGALVVEDGAEEGQSAAVALGVERALAEGFERALCIPGDCPALDPAELDALLGMPGAAETPTSPGDGESPPGASETPVSRSAGGSPPGTRTVTIVPDRHGTGTNGLLLTPPDLLPASFGPGSFERHRALARETGAVCRIERPASLLLDVDTGEDLAALRERLSCQQTRAPRTRAVLGLSRTPCLASAPAA
ncbi:MAG TPA: NTP transferase domain-containing protein [Solirubrobacteraceae bacterium]|nr:NTP transferase domain-containing protein [Solirubrobacteraceae bacterium]